MKLHADGFLGAAMAIEGIDDATVLLHGQAGCRKGLMLSEKFNPRLDRIRLTDDPIYGGCTVAPYSGIKAVDYFGGSLEKLDRAMGIVAKEDYSLIAVMCSPGVSIVGDDCKNAIDSHGVAHKSLLFDNSELGAYAWTGFDVAIERVLRKLCNGERQVVRDTVVVTGLSIMHKDWYTVRNEITSSLRRMGLNPICFAGAGCTVKELSDSLNAEYCIDICPDHSELTRGFYSELGMKVVSIGKAFLGFDNVRELWESAGAVTGKDIAPILADLEHYRMHAYSCIIASKRSFRGRTFSVRSSPSQKEALSRFLKDSFAMVEDDDSPEHLFADGYRCSVEPRNSRTKCIDIGFPTNKVDFSKNPVLGLEGTMYLLDRLFG